MESDRRNPIVITLDASIANVADGLGALLGYEGRAYGIASVSSEFLHKIQQLAGCCWISCYKDTDASYHQILTSSYRL